MAKFQLSRARDLDRDLGSGHTAYPSVIDLYLHTKFH